MYEVRGCEREIQTLLGEEKLVYDDIVRVYFIGSQFLDKPFRLVE